VATVLVINHDASLVLLLETALRRSGHTVISTGDGESGLQVVAQHAPDVIILDARLPGLSSDEVVRWLRHNPATKSVPVILCTTDHLLSGRSPAAYDAHLKLPARPNDITNMVNRLLIGRDSG